MDTNLRSRARLSIGAPAPILLVVLAVLRWPAMAADADDLRTAVTREIDAAYAQLEATYRELHQSPELSFQEVATAGKLAARMRELGFDVTTGIGKTGVVAVLRNGQGPTVLVRCDMDALPVEEKTDLPYASKAIAQTGAGQNVAVMHACGHDVHMTAWLGAARVLTALRARWHGTLVMIAQPAEEVARGAKAMLDDGLLTRFPRPDFALALHVMPDQATGTIGIKAGPIAASSDSVDLRFFGKGGHGAYPHKTVDPIVMASRFVLAVQTLVSRENDPFEPAVATVGSFHAGTKHNIIPDEARLQMTVRAYSDAVRQRLLAGIARIARAEAIASGAPREPEVSSGDGLASVVNHAALTERIGNALRAQLGPDRVVEARPIMAAEDFTLYGRAGIPALLMWLGTSDPAELARAEREGTVVPPLHSPQFAPVPQPTLKGGTDALAFAALELLR